MREELGSTLGGDIGNNAWEQATTALNAGGMGMRRPEEVALTAFIASRVNAWPMVLKLLEALGERDLIDTERASAIYCERTEQAVERLKQNARELGDDGTINEIIEEVITDGAAKAEKHWDKLVEGNTEEKRNGASGPGTDGDEGDEDPTNGAPGPGAFEEQRGGARGSRTNTMSPDGEWDEERHDEGMSPLQRQLQKKTI